MSGWIKIHRDIAKHWISQDMEKLGRWLDLLILASFEDNKVLVGDKLIEVKRGQMIASCDFLAKRWGCSKSTVSKFLELLESDNMVERHTERKITKLTICNYDSYQQREDGMPNDVPNDYRTIAERLPNELKNVEECKELYINNSNACTREENVDWEEFRERGYIERFKAQGTAKQMMTVTGKTLAEITRLMEVYSANRQMSNPGHKDFSHFCEAFKQAILKGKVNIPTAPQAQPQKKVVSNEDHYRLMQEKGWLNN